MPLVGISLGIVVLAILLLYFGVISPRNQQSKTDDVDKRQVGVLSHELTISHSNNIPGQDLFYERGNIAKLTIENISNSFTDLNGQKFATLELSLAGEINGIRKTIKANVVGQVLFSRVTDINGQKISGDTQLTDVHNLNLNIGDMLNIGLLSVSRPASNLEIEKLCLNSQSIACIYNLPKGWGKNVSTIEDFLYGQDDVRLITIDPKLFIINNLTVTKPS